jgi:hypothetical protein
MAQVQLSENQAAGAHGRRAMKSTTIAILLIVASGLSIGCNRAKDEVLPDGTKLFRVYTLENGIKTAERKELSDGTKQFDLIWLKDGTVKAGRVELPDGKTQFDVTWLPDGTQSVGRATKRDGTEMPIFSNAQNDSQGYADVKWGTPISDLDPTVEREPGQCFFSDGTMLSDNNAGGAGAVAAAFGVPTRDAVVAGALLSTNLDSAVVPPKCKSVMKGDVRLISYDDKVAMAFSQLDVHNYESIASELVSKFAEGEGWSVTWGGGAASDGDSTNINVRLFKRGDTNTRVFLLKRTDHQGIGMNVSSAYLLYVPNVDYLRIREDIGKGGRAKEAQQAVERRNREQPDLKKLQ